MKFVTSWDDGHPCDARIAELLARYGLEGSFFVPVSNIEGKPVMSNSALRTLDQSFEIGSHTLEHVYLTRLSKDNCDYQIINGKQGLEDVLGHQVHGFCYPGGGSNSSVRGSVIASGITYARGTENFRLDSGHDRFEIPTTIQFYPHPMSVLLRNFLSKGNYNKRYQVFRKSSSSKNWLNSMFKLIDFYAETDCVFHLWGHSWEVNDNNLWSELEQLLKFASSFNPTSLTVADSLNENFYRKLI